ncbi:hypothetical protein RRG08_044310 [Elysia crispata]|uniref:Uncharacterized protein n=1 Tax=Elysia crispata TaxID=231223 RepID=A0AAE0XXD9_9GAST|nr:hypothetical protein RRG08_044310 [Elysia crispata]
MGHGAVPRSIPGSCDNEVGSSRVPAGSGEPAQAVYLQHKALSMLAPWLKTRESAMRDGSITQSHAQPAC